jgi:hypothetical protein
MVVFYIHHHIDPFKGDLSIIFLNQHTYLLHCLITRCLLGQHDVVDDGFHGGQVRHNTFIDGDALLEMGLEI